MKKILISVLLILGLVAFTTPAIASDATATVSGVTASAEGGTASAEGGSVGIVGGTATGGAEVNVTFPESKDITTANVNAKGYRGFPSGVQMTYPGMPTYLNGPTDGASVTDLETFLAYGNTFDMAILNTMTNANGLDFFSLGNKTTTVAEVGKVADDAKPASVKVLLKKQVKGVYKRAATITVKATDLNTTTEKLLAVAALEAASYGAPEIHVIDSGKMRVMSGSGWGIGLYYYAASLSSGEQSGGMGGGGTGYSQGESGYQDKPWVKVIAVIPAK